MSNIKELADTLMCILKDDVISEDLSKTNGASSPTPDINTVMSRHKGIIPKEHTDHQVMVDHINKILMSGQPQEARRLYDLHISGSGAHVKKSIDPEESGILFVSYDDGSIDLVIAEDVSEALEKTAVEYLRSQGYDEILEKGLKAEHKSKKGGMTAAGVKAYRRENPGSKLQTAVAEKSPTGKRAKRRRSFCSRMSGVKGPMKDNKGRPTRKALALRRWRC